MLGNRLDMLSGSRRNSSDLSTWCGGDGLRGLIRRRGNPPSTLVGSGRSASIGDNGLRGGYRCCSLLVVALESATESSDGPDEHGEGGRHEDKWNGEEPQPLLADEVERVAAKVVLRAPVTPDVAVMLMKLVSGGGRRGGCASRVNNGDHGPSRRDGGGGLHVDDLSLQDGLDGRNAQLRDPRWNDDGGADGWSCRARDDDGVSAIWSGRDCCCA